MAYQTLNINADAIVAHTARLERLNRSALPVAVRQSLNRAAFDVKTNTMPASARKAFIERSPTFFRATSKVKPATGFNMATMQSEVGFLPQSGAKESGGATEDLQEQEQGGIIGHRAFIPLPQARSGGKYNRRVTAKNRLSAIRAKIIDSKNSAGKTKAARFISSAIHAGKGGVVITNGKKKLLVRINSIKRIDGSTVINSTPLYSVQSQRKVRVKKTNFMQKASVVSAGKIEAFYIDEAKKQIAKAR